MPSVPIPDSVDWYVWRVVFAEKATYEEIARSWTLVQLCEANLLLDIQEDVDRQLYESRKR